MFVDFEILEISRSQIHALKVPHKDAFEVRPLVDAVHGEVLEPCSGAFHKVEWQALDDEEIIVCPSYSIDEMEVFQPHGGVGVPRVLDDVWRCTETRREWRLPDPFRKRLWAVGI